jgi:hypothetical protein
MKKITLEIESDFHKRNIKKIYLPEPRLSPNTSPNKRGKPGRKRHTSPGEESYESAESSGRYKPDFKIEEPRFSREEEQQRNNIVMSTPQS